MSSIVAGLLLTSAFAIQIVVVARLEGGADGDWFGWHVANLGDINNDDFEDFAIGSAENGGLVYVYLGSSTFDTIPDLYLSKDSANDLTTGYSFEGLGDLNKDGFDDFMVMYSNQGQRIYVLRIYLGSSMPDTVPDYTIVDTVGHITSSFGLFLASGDVDSNGYPDIAATDFDVLSTDNIVVFLQDSIFNSSPSFVFTDSNPQYGARGLKIADINGDGFADLLTSSENSGSSGNSYLYFGRNLLVNIPDLIFPRFGYHATGDVNGDSVDDFGISLGPSAFYFGGAVLDTLPDLLISSSAVGRISTDAYGDIVESGALPGSLGYIKVYLGGNPMDANMDWDSTFPCAPFEGAVSVDINGDGNYEFLSPSKSYPCDAFRGAVYIFSSDTTTDVSDGTPAPVPKQFTLNQNFPNPFNTSTMISYSMKETGHVNLKIYNIIGEEVITLVDSFQRPGSYKVDWNGEDGEGNQVSSGIYFFNLTVDDFRDVIKATLIR